MNENKKGYWVYSILAVLVFVALFAFWGYLIYDLVLKLSNQDLSNNTVVQALISLIVTVFIGGYFSKALERKNAIKLELFKVKKELSVRLVDCATVLVHHPNDQSIRELLIAESSKVKLYLNDKTLLALNNLIAAADNDSDTKKLMILYEELVSQLKDAIKA